MTARMSRGTATVLSRMLPPEERAGYVDTMAPVRSGARVAAGHVARDHGALFEAWLTDQHRRAFARDVAYVRKVGAPVVVGRGGLPIEWAGTGPADYQGTLCDGRSLAVEAKSVETRLSLRDVAEHQQRDLERTARFRGLALLAVEIRAAEAFYVVPWARIAWRERERTVKRGGKEVKEHSRSIGVEELAGWELDARVMLPKEHPSATCYLERFARAL